tara:strand:+ start:2838 stop:3263 length:426 start_codon:yes stop_codon:yes gene_type:complete
MITAYEYFDEGDERVRDPATYLGTSPLSMVRQFAQAMGQAMNLPFMRGTNVDIMRMSLIEEEYLEVQEAGHADDMLKELADLVYVTYGYAAKFGWDLDEAVRRVHASNMSKLGNDGKPIYREDGKVLKGPNYQKPDLSDLV